MEDVEPRFDVLAPRMDDAMSADGDIERSLLNLDYDPTEAIEEGPVPLPASAHPPQGHWTGLHLAAFAGDVSAVEQLLHAGARVEQRSHHPGGCDGCTALHAAAAAGHPDVVAALLAWGANPHARDEVGMTALHIAAARGDDQTTRLLLKRGARPGDWVADDTALDLAKRAASQAVLGLLKQALKAR